MGKLSDELEWPSPGVLQDATGAQSSMRWAFLMAVPTGCLVVAAATVAMFLNNPQAVSAMAIGAGMVGLSFGGKAWQAQSEAKIGAL